MVLLRVGRQCRGTRTECVRRVRLVPFGSFGVAAAAVGFGLGRFLRFPSGQMMIVAG